MSSSNKKYKYLNYLPKPIHLLPEEYDLVDDEEFCQKDHRIPLLIATQFGIFPTNKTYGEKPVLNYAKLEGLENRTVGFIGRAYASNRERKGIFKIFSDEEFINKLRTEKIQIDLRFWNKDWELKS